MDRLEWEERYCEELAELEFDAQETEESVTEEEWEAAYFQSHKGDKMNAQQIKYILLHSIILTNLFGRNVSLDEAGMHWATTNLAVEYRQRHNF